MGARAICRNCEREMAIMKDHMCGGCCYSADGLEGAEREEALAKAREKFKGKGPQGIGNRAARVKSAAPPPPPPLPPPPPPPPPPMRRIRADVSITPDPSPSQKAKGEGKQDPGQTQFRISMPNSILDFIQDECIVDTWDDVATDWSGLYFKYLDYCIDLGRIPESQNDFSRVLRTALAVGRKPDESVKSLWPLPTPEGAAHPKPCDQDPKPSLQTIILHFNNGDEALLEKLSATAKRFRREPAAQILWTLQHGLDYLDSLPAKGVEAK